MATPGDIFRLSMVSNCLWDCSSGTVAELAQTAATRIPNNMAAAGLTGWSVTWGPMVFKQQDVEAGGPDLVAYVTNKSDTYVVAIAGTNQYSNRAKMIYDIKIQCSVDFEAWRNQSGAVASPPNVVEKADPSKANVAEGTARGVYDLATTQTLLGPSSGTTIVTYLSGLKSGSKLIYTGHSLGGALSPTLALGLLNELSNINPGDTSTFPTAGPTPGNTGFASLFTEAFPASGGFNQNIINTRDTVTFAWNIDNVKFPERCLQYLLEVFGHIGPSQPLLYASLTWFLKNAENAQNNGMTYAFLPSFSFTGTNQLPSIPATTLKEYLADALVAHIADYKTYFGVKSGELDGIAPAFPLPIGPELAEFGNDETTSV